MFFPLQKLSRLGSLALSFLPPDQSLRGYAVCSAPRAGTTWLCQLLESTDTLGKPIEYFNGPFLRRIVHPAYPERSRLQARCVLRMGATTNGIYGFKILADQHEVVSAKLDLAAMLPNLNFVYLKRNDLLGQAISFARARQTGQFRSTHKPGTAKYDRRFIEDCMGFLSREYEYWEGFFAREKISPLRLVYEDVLKDPQRAIESVAALFGTSAQIGTDSSAITLAILRDAVSDDWRQRFLEEKRRAA